MRVTEAPLADSKKLVGCTWYAPPLAQFTLLLTVLATLLPLNLNGSWGEILWVHLIYATALALLTSSCFFHLHPSALSSNKGFASYTWGFTWNAAPLAQFAFLLAFVMPVLSQFLCVISNPRWYLSFYFNFVEVVFSTCWLSIIILGDKQGKIGLLSQWMLDGWVEQLIVFFFTNINFISIFHISQKALNL